MTTQNNDLSSWVTLYRHFPTDYQVESWVIVPLGLIRVFHWNIMAISTTLKLAVLPTFRAILRLNSHVPVGPEWTSTHTRPATVYWTTNLRQEYTSYSFRP
jgi:hypothetical protein